jgi:hypothetical protein
LACENSPTTPKTPGGKKPSWAVYEAAGTDKWEEAVKFAKPIIGIKEWSEVRYTGAIEK